MIDKLPSSTRRVRPIGAEAGFTLIELLTTIAILAIILAVATPSFIQFQRNSELRGAVNDLLNAVTAARVEAMKRGRPVIVEPAAGTKDWSKGWVMYFNTGSGSGAVKTEVAQGKPFPSSVTVQATTGEFDEGIRFTPAGVPSKVDGTSGLAAGSITLDNGTEKRTLQMSATGRGRICNPAKDSGC